MKTITAICKALSGHEWVMAMARSILPVADRLIIAFPQTDWNGRPGNEVERLCGENLAALSAKISTFRPESKDQAGIYQELIREADRTPYDYLQVIDCDEVWDDWAIRQARSALDGDANAYSVKMFSYIRSPFYRVVPLDRNVPTCFIKKGVPYKGIRWSGISRNIIPNIYFHHFSAVRRNLSDVVLKFNRSNTAEKIPPINDKAWVENVWNKLPDAKNINPNIGLAHIWPAVVRVDMSDLPISIRNEPMVTAFKDYCKTETPKTKPNPEKKMAATPPDITLASLFKEYGLPENFGPNHPKWWNKKYRIYYQRIMKRINPALGK